jgi:prepilin-type N-terminal cleavage/methylation domain-containing protein
MPGFTLIELMIVLGIIVLISMVLLLSNQRFNSSILLRNLAYQIGLSVREAQLYGVAVGNSNVSANCLALTGEQSKFCASFGIYLDTSLDDRYALFADGNNNGVYDTSGSDSIVRNYLTQYGFRISNLCAIGAGASIPVTCSSACPAAYQTAPYNCASGSLQKLQLTFRRPNPDAFIRVNNDSATSYTTAYIEVQAAGGATRSLTVSQIGQITIMGTGN